MGWISSDYCSHEINILTIWVNWWLTLWKWAGLQRRCDMWIFQCSRTVILGKCFCHRIKQRINQFSTQFKRISNSLPMKLNTSSSVCATWAIPCQSIKCKFRMRWLCLIKWKENLLKWMQTFRQSLEVYPIVRTSWHLTGEWFVALGIHWMLDMVVKRCHVEPSNGLNTVDYWLLVATYECGLAVAQYMLALADSRRQFPKWFSVRSILPPFHWWLNRAIGLPPDDGLYSSLMRTIRNKFTCTHDSIANQSNQCVQQIDQFSLQSIWENSQNHNRYSNAVNI